jgi:hypothetical protein
MADFEGIPLAGEGPACGCVLMLRAGSAISRVVNLPQGVEVEVRRGVPAVVVRGVSAADHESVLFQGPELANRALDILAMAGMATMALADVWSCHVAWWPAPQASVIRIWCSAALTLKIEASAVVHGPDGAVRSAETGATPQWHESMRYLRMSETTDDLFDAFRNVYLALESLLDRLQPRTPGEGEGTWLKRALTWVHATAGLEAYLPGPVGDPVQAIYDELWKEVRNSVFHANDPTPVSRQNRESRAGSTIHSLPAEYLLRNGSWFALEQAIFPVLARSLQTRHYGFHRRPMVDSRRAKFAEP